MKKINSSPVTHSLKKILLSTAFICQIMNGTSHAAKNYFVSTFAGSGTQGKVDGQGNAASFSTITDITIDSQGNLYISDSGNNVIRKITPSGVVSTFAGGGSNGISSGSADGQNTAALFNNPGGINIDSNGNLYIVDAGNNSQIRMITQQGAVSTIPNNQFLSSTPSLPTPNNPPSSSLISYLPTDVVVDSMGNLYAPVANDTHSIHLISATGAKGLFAGMKNVHASCTWPCGLKFNASNNVYVADNTSHVIRQISNTSTVSVFAGSGTAGKTDGQGTAASFSAPSFVVADQFGNLWVADTGNHAIRKISPTGAVTTIGGTGSPTPFQDNQNAITATFNTPRGLAIDGQNNIYVCDSGNFSIRKLSPNFYGSNTTDITMTNTDYGQEPLNLAGGVIQAGAAGLNVANAINLNGSSTIDVHSFIYTLSGPITGNNNNITVQDTSGSATPGTLVLSGATNGLGSLIIVNNATAAANNTSSGSSTSTSSSTTTSAGPTVQLGGNISFSTVNNGGTLDLNGFQLVILGQTATLGKIIDSSANKTGSVVWSAPTTASTSTTSSSSGSSSSTATSSSSSTASSTTSTSSSGTTTTPSNPNVSAAITAIIPQHSRANS